MSCYESFFRRVVTHHSEGEGIEKSSEIMRKCDKYLIFWAFSQFLSLQKAQFDFN